MKKDDLFLIVIGIFAVFLILGMIYLDRKENKCNPDKIKAEIESMITSARLASFGWTSEEQVNSALFVLDIEIKKKLEELDNCK